MSEIQRTLASLRSILSLSLTPIFQARIFSSRPDSTWSAVRLCLFYLRFIACLQSATRLVKSVQPTSHYRSCQQTGRGTHISPPGVESALHYRISHSLFSVASTRKASSAKQLPRSLSLFKTMRSANTQYHEPTPTLGYSMKFSADH